MSEVFAKRPYVLETSRYVNQINRYLEFFPASQLHCVLLEDLRTDADAALASVFEFIGLAPLPVGVPTAKTFERGQPQTARMGNRLLTAARSAPGAGLAANVLPQGARQALREVFRKSLPESRLGKWVVDRQIAQAEPLSEAARQRLHDELDDSTLELEAYLGRDLSHWRRGGVRGR